MRRSKFMQMVNQAISLAVKKKTRHYESLWSNQKPGNLAILDIETLRSEIVRVCTTPVRTGYVRKVEDWELPHFSPSDWGVEMDEEKGSESSTEPCPVSTRSLTPLRDKLEVALEIENKRKSTARKLPKSVESKRSQEGQRLEGCNLEEEASPQTNQISWCPGLTKLLVGKDSVVSMFTKIEGLKEELNMEIEGFERKEKRRRKRVLGIIRCRRKSTFLKQKSSKGNVYIDHLREVLCASSDRLEAIREFMQQFYKNYNAALVRFIRTRKASFPFGILKMRTLFRADYGPPQIEDPFDFQC